MFASNTSQVSADQIYIEDVFSTYLYTGNGSSQTITNGIDIAGKGALIWTKCRNDGVLAHRLNDTERGITNRLFSNLTNAQSASATSITATSSTGYTVGSENGFNENTKTFASWTFRKQAKFFDVVTYEGTGSNRTISHNLGSTPGCIIVKKTSGVGPWPVYHRSLTDASTSYVNLNETSARGVAATYWNSTAPTSTVFSLGTSNDVNQSGETYVAYLFAHDAGGFGTSGTENVISCGSFTTDGSGNATVTLGYEPQWYLIKRTNAAQSWFLLDTMRGWTATANTSKVLIPNLTNAESTVGSSPTATGFTTDANLTNASSTYIYIAIRRGPMKTPTSGTSVFDPDTYTGNDATSRLISSGFAADFAYIRDRNDGTEAYRQNYVQDRLRGGGRSLVTNSTGAEGADTGWTNPDMANEFESNSGILVTPYFSRYNASSKSYVSYQFQRAPGFFDVVCYTGTGSATTFSHNLGVAPELMLVKNRNNAENWGVYSAALGNTKRLRLNSTDAAVTASAEWNNTSPTASVFTVGTDQEVNFSSNTYVAYLFASCPGVSKVGSYTGTGTTLQVNCGFTSGARFVLIKRTDSTGDWYVWDSTRGIVAGNDPYLLLNSTAAEVTNTDYVDTYSAGFEISSTAPAAINANGGTFIYLAIA